MQSDAGDPDLEELWRLRSHRAAQSICLIIMMFYLYLITIIWFYMYNDNKGLFCSIQIYLYTFYKTKCFLIVKPD